MFDDPVTRIPVDVVSRTSNPAIVIHDFDETLNPEVPPLTITDSPGSAWKEMGVDDVPELVIVTASLYVPAETRTDVPATARAAPAEMVQSGSVAVPGPASEQAPCAWST